MKDWENERKFRGVNGVSMKMVIVTECLIGEGTSESPVKSLIQVWDMDGTLIASNPPINETGSVDPAYRYLSR